MFDPRILRSRNRPLVMGVLNVTPDSFSDGGAFFDPERATDRAGVMLAEGADLIDIGPESTRPGASPVPADEQIRRALPVIERVCARHPQAVLSLDTQLSGVARAGLEAGVSLINDVSALRNDPDIATLIAKSGAGVVLMHMRGTPADMQDDPRYGDVVAEVADFLAERARAALDAGIAPERILLDPGIGFGKSAAHNLTLLANLTRFVELGYPVLLGASRKRFIGEIAKNAESADDRLGGSLACAARAFAAGAAVLRVHNVKETLQLLDVLAAIENA